MNIVTLVYCISHGKQKPFFFFQQFLNRTYIFISTKTGYILKAAIYIRTKPVVFVRCC